MRLLILVLLLCLVFLPAHGQDVQGSAAQPGPATGQGEREGRTLKVTEVVAPRVEVPFQQNLLFIIDISGSMRDQQRMAKALAVVRALIDQPVDEYYIALIAFSGGASRWSGIPGENVPANWAAMPSGDAVRQAQAWLSNFKNDGNTNPTQAINQAFADARQPLSIILVTDGGFDGGVNAPEVVRQAQQARTNSGKTEAIMTVIGVGAAAGQMQVMRDLGELGRGGLYVHE